MEVEVDRVEPEPVHAALQPETRRGKKRFLHLRIVEVEVRLFLQEIVHVVLLAPSIPLPGRAAEDRQPVVGRGAVGAGVSPNVPVGARIVARGPALHEPRVLVGGMGQHEVDHHLEPEPVRLGHHGVEILQRAEHRVDVVVVRHVVAVVPHRGPEERRYPDRVCAQRGDMRQPHEDAAQVADAVPVRILEGAWIDLVDDGAAPPVAVNRRSGRACFRAGKNCNRLHFVIIHP